MKVNFCILVLGFISSAVMANDKFIPIPPLNSFGVNSGYSGMPQAPEPPSVPVDGSGAYKIPEFKMTEPVSKKSNTKTEQKKSDVNEGLVAAGLLSSTGSLSGASSYLDTLLRNSYGNISGTDGNAGEKALLESRHSLSVAERNYLKGGDSVEKTFLTELKEAYQQGSTVLDSRETYLEKVVDFETVRVQGFSPSSAKYKTAFLEKESAASDVEKNLRNLNFLLEILSEKCGTELSFLPGFIPVPGLVDFGDFKEETFLELEEADYNNLLGNISRKSNKTWSLSAEAGYDYTGSGLAGNYSGSETHEISAGVKAAFSGLELGTGVSIPLSEKGEPGITISAGWDSFSGRDKKLEKESENYDLLTELLDIQDAKESYRNAKDTYQRQKDDLLWSLKILEEQCSYYEQIGNDTREAYEKGLVSYQDFLESSNLYNKIKIQYILAVINMRLYNIEVRSLFSGDTEL